MKHIIHFLLIINLTSALSQENINCTELVEAAKEGNYAKVKELVEKGFDINCKGIDGYTAIEDAKTLEIVKYLHQNGGILTEDVYFSHSLFFAEGREGEHLEIMKYMVENKAIVKDDLYYMSDANLEAAACFPEYASYLKKMSVKFNQNDCNRYLYGYYDIFFEELLYYGNEKTLSALKEYIKNGIGRKEPLKNISDFSSTVRMDMLISYIYFLDSAGIRLNQASIMEKIESACYTWLDYAYSDNDSSIIDLMVWLAEKGIYKHKAVECIAEKGGGNYAMELRFLEGLASHKYFFGFKDDRAVLQDLFLQYMNAYTNGSFDYTYLTRFCVVFQNENNPYFFIPDFVEGVSLDVVFEIISAMNHDYNKVKGENLINAIKTLYDIFYDGEENDKLIEFINTPLKNGKTMLMIAVSFCDMETVNFLVESGADTKQKDDAGKQAKDYTICQPIIECLNSH
ncbi:MAG: hypothetical protein JXB49_29255 [Bacteroidales bacterium]|nr:hypothetical protein [Bacteroidales bacterium]